MLHPLKEELDSRPMQPFQYIAIGICMLMSIMDGFDVMVMAFTAADISKEWALNGKELGMMFSAGLVGMASGAIFLAPAADKFGRKPLLVVCLILSGVCMIMSAWAPNAVMLGVFRFLTGIGIGGVLASTNVIASEYASKKWRNLAITLQATGYAIGATLGGIISIYLINHFGWQSVFLSGGVATLFIMLIVLVYLPESLDFLLEKQPRNALQRINAVCVKLRLKQITSLPSPALSATKDGDSKGFARLFSKRYAMVTICLWSAFFLVMFGYYFVMSWTPKLLNSYGLSKDDGITVGVLLSAGGILGTILIGVIAARFNMAKVQSVFLLATGILMPLLLWGANSTTVIFAVGLMIGIFINGCVGGLYALATTSYDTSVRATGVGMTIGFGRVGGIISPFFAGYMVDRNIEIQVMYMIYACVFLACIAFTVSLARIRKSSMIAQ